MTEMLEEAVGVTTDTGYDVTLVTADGQESVLHCDSGTTVLEAAEDSGIMLKSSCESGGCGACSAVLTRGRVEMGEHDPNVIEVPEEQGGILLCRSFPREDCRIALPYDQSKIVVGPPVRHEAEITGLDRVADGVMRLTLTLRPGEDGSASADFESGQFVRIVVPGLAPGREGGVPGNAEGREVRRAYSPANVSNWDGRLEFYIRLLPGGAMSDYLAERAEVGDVLTVSSADGEFGLAENGLRPRWFLAGGTGLSPLLSMLRKMAEWGEAQPARLFFGVTRHSEVFAQDEIASLTESLPDFQAVTVVWNPDPAWDGAVGNPVELAAAEIAVMDEMPDVYLCGPPPMMDAAVAALTAAGVPADQIHLERFSSAM
ncbi:MAG: 2Fe-2S iron-sulfur cluster-binding protein [Mycobacterium sp.]